MPEFGPISPFSQQLHADKYRGPGESFKEGMNRVSNAISDDEPHFRTTRDILLDQRFLPAGRVQAAMGAAKIVTPYNCFVSGTIEDSFVDGHASIMKRATQAAQTMRMGGGIGYDFSTLRPRGAHIRKLGSKSSGPVSFMEIYDAICRCIASSGHRRGAQMGVLRIDHPDIEEFIHAKQNENHLTGFNMSVAVTDEFMECLADGRPFELKFEGRVYNEVEPEALWNMLMRSTWDWAEPGVIFVDTINRMNNLHYCETIAATNPCGEQPLPPYGACLLGSFNLAAYVVTDPKAKTGYRFDRAQFREDIPTIVRAMDNVIDRATYPLYEQEQEAKNKRRMGLGLTGVANAFEALGFPYGSVDFADQLASVLQDLNVTAYLTSSQMAAEKGSFKLYNDRYLDSGFMETMPEFVRQEIAHHGIRNSHLTSIAPTGTISMTADNVSSGIEPVFAFESLRKVQTEAGEQEVTLMDFGVEHFGHRGKPAAEVTIDEHLRVHLAAANGVDSAVSKTLNVPPTTPWNDFKNIYVRAWEGGAKGCTTYTAGGKREGILKDAAEEAACRIDLETGRRECD